VTIVLANAIGSNASPHYSAKVGGHAVNTASEADYSIWASPDSATVTHISKADVAAKPATSGRVVDVIYKVTWTVRLAKVNSYINDYKNDQEYLTTDVAVRREAKRWFDETGHISSVSDITNHPSAQLLAVSGERSLKYAIKTLDKHPYHWLALLPKIVGYDPVPANLHHKMREIVQFWLGWYNARTPSI